MKLYKRLCNNNKEYKLLILGHGNLEHKLKLRCKELGIFDKVLFVAGLKIPRIT